MTANIITEKYLLFKARNKDPEAYSKIYDLYVDKIYRFVFFKINSKEEAQDLTSEVFLKTWEYIISGKEISNLNAYLYKVARNLVIDYYRKAAHKGVSLDALDSGGENLRVDNIMITQGQDELDSKIQLEKIQDKLQGLKDDYREIIILRYVDGLSIGEIAEIVEKKNGAVRVILYRATNALRELMGEK
ncbi:MAG: RNA polymerase sigma factor [Candidatus Parcubacteria bacterium]|nr:RNA polymerase sigma factor [Candidatus Parcubacteria bacterium]